MQKPRVLVLAPFDSRWLEEIRRCVEDCWDVRVVSLGAPQPRPQGMALVELAIDFSRRLDRLIKDFNPDGVVVNFEFCWDLFLTPEFFIPFDPDRIVAAVWDDSVFHELNRAVLDKIRVRKVLVGDKIGEFRYAEEGFSSQYIPLEGSEDIYYSYPDIDPAYDVSFFGACDKADRREYLQYIAKTIPINYNDSDRKVIGVSYRELGDMIRNSKIILNLSKSDPDSAGRVRYQMKGRIFETIFCGSLPITETCPNTAILFNGLVPSFEDPAQAVELIGYYLRNESERKSLILDLAHIAKQYRPHDIYRKLFL